MSELSSLSPSSLWGFFEKICSIPHPSYHEEQLAEYIIQLAKEKKIEVHKDKVGNIFLRKPATKGMEKRKLIAFQAHLDMVPQKNSHTEHDFTTDPIQPYIDGEWVKAKDTTLGADNGIGLASILAIFFDPNIEHGPIEALLTMTEEAGMEGAFGLEGNYLKSNYLINTDSETEGEICIGCAGGIDFNTKLPLIWQTTQKNHIAYEISLTGLIGGHSGVDIHLERGNANVILSQFLFHFAQELDLNIYEIKGGSLRNAIPREAFAKVTVPIENEYLLIEKCDEFLSKIKYRFNETEPNFSLIAKKLSKLPEKVYDGKFQKTLLSWLNIAQNGVVTMSKTLENVVETSLNLGIIKSDENDISLIFLIRSFNETSKMLLVDQLIAHSFLVNAKYQTNNNYPGWEPDLSSSLLQLAQNSYKQLYEKTMKTSVIHAGLECGLFKRVYPKMEMISIGPTIVSPHSPDEKVNILTVSRYWQLLLIIIKNIPEA